MRVTGTRLGAAALWNQCFVVLFACCADTTLPPQIASLRKIMDDRLSVKQFQKLTITGHSACALVCLPLCLRPLPSNLTDAWARALARASFPLFQMIGWVEQQCPNSLSASSPP